LVVVFVSHPLGDIEQGPTEATDVDVILDDTTEGDRARTATGVTDDAGNGRQLVATRWQPNSTPAADLVHRSPCAV